MPFFSLILLTENDLLQMTLEASLSSLPFYYISISLYCELSHMHARAKSNYLCVYELEI